MLGESLVNYSKTALVIFLLITFECSMELTAIEYQGHKVGVLPACLANKTTNEMTKMYIDGFYGADGYDPRYYKDQTIWTRRDPGKSGRGLLRSSDSLRIGIMKVDVLKINEVFLRTTKYSTRLRPDSSLGFRVVFVVKKNERLVHMESGYRDGGKLERQNIDRFIHGNKTCDSWYRKQQVLDKTIDKFEVYVAVPAGEISSNFRMDVGSCVAKSIFSHLGFRGVNNKAVDMVEMSSHGIVGLSEYAQWLTRTRFSQDAPDLANKSKKEAFSDISKYFEHACQ